MCVYVSLIYIEFRPLNHCNSWTPGARMDLKIAMDSPKSSLSNEPSPMPLTAIISEIIKASDSSEFWRLLGIVEIIIIKASDSSEFWRLLGIVDILFFFFLLLLLLFRRFCTNPANLPNQAIDLKFKNLKDSNLNLYPPKVGAYRTIRSRAITLLIFLEHFQIWKTICPIRTRLDSFESLFNF